MKHNILQRSSLGGKGFLPEGPFQTIRIVSSRKRKKVTVFFKIFLNGFGYANGKKYDRIVFNSFTGSEMFVPLETGGNSIGRF